LSTLVNLPNDLALNPQTHKKRFSLGEREIKLFTTKRDGSEHSEDRRATTNKDESISPPYKLNENEEYKHLLASLTKIDLQLEQSVKDKNRRRSLEETLDLKKTRIPILGININKQNQSKPIDKQLKSIVKYHKKEDQYSNFNIIVRVSCQASLSKQRNR
jgi:hypothetical protein